MVCRELKKRLGNCFMDSIVKRLKEDTIHPDSSIVGFCFPIYFSGMPNIVKTFINKVDFSNVDYIFVMATKSQYKSPGIIDEQINCILKKYEKTVNSIFYLDMVGNFIKKHDILPEIKQKAKNEETIRKMDSILDIVKKRENIIENPIPLMKFIGRNNYNSWVSNYNMSDRLFITNTCNSCGLCVRICPVSNIALMNGRPSWHHNCEFCMGCIHICPLKGIQYGKFTLKRNRYRNPNISLSDLLEDRS